MCAQAIQNDFKAPSVDQKLVLENSKQVWKNIVNPYRGSQLESPYQLISLFYVAYLKNKEETAKNLDDPPINQIECHEFSPSFLKF